MFISYLTFPHRPSGFAILNCLVVRQKGMCMQTYFQMLLAVLVQMCAYLQFFLYSNTKTVIQPYGEICKGYNLGTIFHAPLML